MYLPMFLTSVKKTTYKEVVFLYIATKLLWRITDFRGLNVMVNSFYVDFSKRFIYIPTKLDLLII